jgi:hypothetical protein
LAVVVAKTAAADRAAKTSEAVIRKIRSMAGFPHYSIPPVHSTRLEHLDDPLPEP